MKLNNKGFTLIEMILVTAIFMVVIMITGDAFKTILTQTMKLYKSEESNIEGVVGLEMFRHDLEQAGFGLPYSYPATVQTQLPVYLEAGYAPANNYNDATRDGNTVLPLETRRIPRAFVAGDNLTGVSGSGDSVTYGVLANTDYLAIKATSVGGSDASQKWTYANYSSTDSNGGSKAPKIWPGGNFKGGDLVIALRRTFNDSGYGNQLAYDNASIYWTSYSKNGFTPGFSPTQPAEVVYIYGIRDSNPNGLRMPFNRVDYFVARPSDATKIPTTCAPSTGILYRASIDQADGKLNYKSPILDCVADMQVVFGWNLADSNGNLIDDPNTSGSGSVDAWSNADGSTASTGLSLPTGTSPSGKYIKDVILTDPAHIRTKLKVVKVFILAQNGRKDPNYTSPSTIAIGDPGEASLTRANGFPITQAMLNYRWKVYRLVIKPKNLVSNQ